MNCESRLEKVKELDCLVVLGLSPDFDQEILICSEEEIPSDLDVLEFYRSKKRSELKEILAELRKRYDFKIMRPKHTHEERVKIAGEFLKEIGRLEYISSACIIGSVADNEDHELSDIDIKLIRNYCPNKTTCKIRDLVRTESKYYLIDFWCYPEK